MVNKQGYNAIIAVCSEVQQWHRALDLLQKWRDGELGEGGWHHVWELMDVFANKNMFDFEILQERGLYGFPLMCFSLML